MSRWAALAFVAALSGCQTLDRAIEVTDSAAAYKLDLICLTAEPRRSERIIELNDEMVAGSVDLRCGS